MHNHTTWQRAAAALTFGLAVTALGGLTACDRPAGRTDADNTARNARDSGARTATPMDQGENEGDRTITQHVRKVVVDNNALSTNAHNVKIITQNGVVTLRGPVETPQEKNTIVAAAEMTPGVKRVDDQLEVKAAD
jgi:osmotically-inducible protein OsmY